MEETVDLTRYLRPKVTRADRWAGWLTRYWFALFSLLMGILVSLPFLAPVFMAWGWQAAGSAIYYFYSWLCHQLPQRSYFLFGPGFTYTLPELQAAGATSLDPMVLRQFVGSPELGWKIAWSDRMVSMYTGIWIFGLLWRLVRQSIRPLPLWGLILLSLPMAIDGTAHFISDLAGIGQGFRDTNAWLAALTNYRLPESFYTGDAWGSFNSIMRLLTGALFGVGIIWYGFPIIDKIISLSGQLRDTSIQIPQQASSE
jgi:uncharacterized membrane protein